MVKSARVASELAGANELTQSAGRPLSRWHAGRLLTAPAIELYEHGVRLIIGCLHSFWVV
jgi:hypothetical protein